MARLLQAIAKYGPRVAQRPTAQMGEIAQWIAQGTGIRESQVTMVLMELNQAIIHYNALGTPVRLPGIAIVGVSVDRSGKRHIAFRADPSLGKALNGPRGRTLPLNNAANIGLDDAGYKARWDVEHPDDPLILITRS